MLTEKKARNPKAKKRGYDDKKKGTADQKILKSLGKKLVKSTKSIS